MLQQSRQETIKSHDQKIEGRYYILDQKNDSLQNCFGCFCQSSNQYTIAESDPNFSVSSKKGVIKQNSDCLSRVTCVCNRPFTGTLKMLNEQIAYCQRPCRCWIECCPFLENQLIIKGKGEKLMGTLRIPCWFYSGNYYPLADVKLQILNDTNNVLFSIEGNCLQKSNLCPCFRCCYCPNIEYNIFDSAQRKVGKITNIFNGCIAQCTSRADKFGIQFPFKCEQNNKILIIFATMYLDYLRFQTPICCGGID